MSVLIVKHKPEYSPAFKALNKEWIEKYFVMEDSDYKSLDNPDNYIIANGGEILYAIQGKKPVGVCALIKMNHPEFEYELAKMAVKPSHHGQGIGKVLCQAIINLAREKGAKNLYLESNRKLIPAISLYKKLGFIELIGYTSPYERSDIQMVNRFEN